MKHATIRFAALVALAVAGAPALAEVRIGDPAPPLTIKEWVLGKPVNLSREAARKIHMVEFWAVWCPPCKASVPLLSQYQKKYKKDLVIIGVTDPDPYRNSPKAIKRFVKKQGANMDYTVAIDDAGETWTKYLGRADVAIPHAFLVGRDGRVVWQGSPLDPALEQVLPAVIDGTFDVTTAKLEAEVNRRLAALSLSIEMGQWGVVWDGLIDILKLDPANEAALNALVSIYALELRNTRTFRSWVRSHIDANRGDPKSMTRLAITLLHIGDFATRAPDLALEAAKASYESSRRRDALAIAVYARALYQIGDLERAITLQKDAVAAATDSQRSEIKKTLDYYKLCEKLRETTR